MSSDDPAMDAVAGLLGGSFPALFLNNPMLHLSEFVFDFPFRFHSGYLSFSSDDLDEHRPVLCGFYLVGEVSALGQRVVVGHT